MALDVAEALSTEIISADSRQIYKDIPIGTAAPTEVQLSRVKHHLVGILDLEEYYSASRFEEDALEILESLWRNNDYAVVCGGSMMYIDALTNGMDDLPFISDKIRTQTLDLFLNEGIEAIRRELSIVDPRYYEIVDKSNHRRMIHALEIYRECGVPYSSLRKGRKKERPFRILKYAIDFSREALFERINSRVTSMIEAGFIEEARKVYHLKNLNSLNTVGYKELFAAFDGNMSLPEAIARIAKNTRVYAKKQLTWMKKDPSIIYLSTDTDLKEAVLERL